MGLYKFRGALSLIEGGSLFNNKWGDIPRVATKKYFFINTIYLLFYYLLFFFICKINLKIYVFNLCELFISYIFKM